IDHSGDQFAQWLDYDEDHFPDLQVIVPGSIRIYHNSGHGQFQLHSLSHQPSPIGASNTNGGTINGTLAADAIVDQAGGPPLVAASVPVNGMLYKLSKKLFVDATTSNVGIGTLTPAAKLDVAGVVWARGGVKFPDGTKQLTAGGGGGVGPQGPPGP